MLRTVVGGALVLAVFPAGASAADPARYIPVFTGGENRLAQRPGSIGFGAANLVSGIRWRGWDGSNARGRGRLTSTSGGYDISARVRIKAYRVRDCDGKKTYTRFKLTRVSGDAIGALSQAQPAPCPE